MKIDISEELAQVADMEIREIKQNPPLAPPKPEETGDTLIIRNPKQSGAASSDNLKIDISKELARVSDMEIKYGCSKQEVERVIVSCEGDLDKAIETLREIKQNSPLASPKPEETGDTLIISNPKQSGAAIAWLFESGQEDNLKDKTIGSDNLKIDILEELAWVADMEIRYGCSKQEVERVIVSCEGDLDKATETLREIKQDPPLAPPKSKEIGDPLIISNPKQSGVASQSQRPLTKPVSFPNQQKRDEKEFNCAKATVVIGASPESCNRNMHPLKRTQPKSE
ncbi:hypothetical protein RIF29_20378 [Crotalaria pallida]|uniref:UBA domain-containing protein n=1 Tax=Crotalaria pallida TaxID=3830 RepID=A0AAN9I8M3_CROPI